MAVSDNRSIEERRKYVEAWNKTMIDMWEERIALLKVIDTKALYRSLSTVKLIADADYSSVSVEHSFLEYGIWQDLGVGRDVAHGNTHRADMDGWQRKREPRRWFSTKYYRSVLAIRDFFADSIGKEFAGIVCNGLDSDRARRSTDFYRRKGYA